MTRLLFYSILKILKVRFDPILNVRNLDTAIKCSPTGPLKINSPYNKVFHLVNILC